MAIPLPRDQSRHEFLNLRSNELGHPKLRGYFRELLGNLDTDHIHRYPDHAITRRLVADTLGAPLESVLLTSGGDPAIELVLRALRRTHDAILLQEPSYLGWDIYSRLNGFRQVLLSVEPTYAGRTSVEQHCEGLLRAIAAWGCGRLLVVIVNPHSPTGVLLPLGFLAEVLRLCETRGHTLVLDACYEVFGGVSQSSTIQRFSHSFIIHSFSKSHGLAGGRIGAIVSGPQQIEYLSRWRPENSLSGITAALLSAMLRDPSFVDDVRRDIIRERGSMEQRICLEISGLKAAEARTNFSVFLCEDRDQRDGIVEACRSSKILVGCFDAGAELRHYLRVTVGMPDGVTRLIGAVKAEGRR